MLPHKLVRSRCTAIVAAIATAAGFACAALGCTYAHAQGASRTDALVRTLVDGASRHIPKGYSTANATRVTLNDDDRSSGMIAGVVVALGGGDPKGSLRYGLFQSEQQAETFTRNLGYRRPAGSSPRFLQYVPSADCADTPSGGLCSMRIGDVVIVATAGAVDRGASFVMIAAKDALDAATMGLGTGPSTVTLPKSAATSSRDGCALLTKTDAAAALGGPVADPRRSGDTCYYGAPVAGRDSVTLQLFEGGRSKFDFDRGRMQRIASASGIGDDAFSFVSDAGFVQVYFIKGTSYAALTLQSSRDVNRLEVAKALARKIAASL